MLINVKKKIIYLKSHIIFAVNENVNAKEKVTRWD